MSATTTVATTATFIGKRALTELARRAGRLTPQSKFEAENQEQFELLAVENSQAVQVMAERIGATDSRLAHLSNRVEEVAQVIIDLIEHQRSLIGQYYNNNPEDQPAQEDQENVAQEAAKSYYYAGSNEKREIVWAAFSNSFHPRFYKEGLYKILWALVKELEYPHFRVLKELQTRSILHKAVESAFFARRLADLGLVREEFMGDDRLMFIPSPIALKLLEFATPPASPT